MFQQKSMQVPLGILCFVFILLFSCETDPKQDDETTTADQSFSVVSHLNAEPDMLHPILSTSGYTRSVTNQIFSNLVHYNTETLELSPMLAKSLPKTTLITEGENKGKVRSDYEIHEEAIWDDGTPITGHDVDFSLKAVMNPKVPAAQYRSFSNQFRDIIIDPDNPKKFSTISNDYFLVDYILADIPVFPAHIYDPEGLMKNFTIKQLSDTETACRRCSKPFRSYSRAKRVRVS